MGYEIKKVAVLGAGVMGQGIAAHLANAGIPSVLFDIVPQGAEPRSMLAINGIENAKKLRPAAFFTKKDADLITPANYEDDAALLKGCDLIIEVVLENINIKKKVFGWVAEHRRPGSIVTSNTSGLSLATMAAVMPEEMAAHFLVTHFFNPVRYMRLLELVGAEQTKPEVMAAVARFGEEVLGKGIIFGKDTPNFVANRIGVFGIASVFKRMVELDMTIEEVDAVFGKPMGRPKSAVYRTADLVGNDTLVHVIDTVYEGCPEDESRDYFIPPQWLKEMVAAGANGDKSGFGFYKKERDASGKKTILARNWKTGEYAVADKPRFGSIGVAKGSPDSGASMKAMVYGKDKGAELAWACTADTLIYTANRLPEIADDIVNIDRAMRWGFAWDLGPFESWDAIGVQKSVKKMKDEGRAIPAWVDEMLATGRKNFYEWADGRHTYWCPLEKVAKPVPFSDRWFFIKDLKRDKKVVLKKNMSADLLDMGDGVLLLEFHSKMNALDADIIKLYGLALDLLEAEKYEGLVIGNQGGNAFCAGANLFMVGMAAATKQWGMLETVVKDLQEVCQRAKYSVRPVVTAPWGLVLGGGCEVAMQCAHTQAAGETYMGLVEVGVGVIPAGGGCKEMLARYMGDIPEGTEYDPNPFVQAAYKNIALAKVAVSGEEARELRYLRPTDRLSLDPDAQLMDAKKVVLGLRQAGYKPPRRVRFKVPGPTGRAAIELFLYQMHQGGYATNHDMVVGKKLAYVMTGGDRPFGAQVVEEDIIELEREAFLSLCGHPDTQARIQHMLQTGKPLRN
ncbi:MAG: 3-hydroxyacyl-CoA dehydrogenase/enoyl-CoA hydratase family protein [Pseudomonadota bacterium]